MNTLHLPTKYTIGHPVYGGANRYATFGTKLGLKRELICRGVSEIDADNAIAAIDEVRGITVFTADKRWVIEMGCLSQ